MSALVPLIAAAIDPANSSPPAWTDKEVSSDNYSSLSTTIRIPGPLLSRGSSNDNYFSPRFLQSALPDYTAAKYASPVG